MNVCKLFIGLLIRTLGQMYAKAKGYCHKIDIFLFQRFLYFSVNKEFSRQYQWDHWAPIRAWAMILFGILWLFPLVTLNVWYNITTIGCSSPQGRDWLGSFCPNAHRSMPAQRPPWYVDLWDSRDSVTHDVRLPAQDRALVIGYHHICDAEHYLSHQLAKTTLLTDDTIDLQLSLNQALVTLSTLCPQLQTFSDSFCIEKDIQNHALRSLVEAYIALTIRSDRMHLSFWHYWVNPLNPLIRLFNVECRIQRLYEPRLFDFQIHTEIQFQLQHFLTESRQSMDRVEAEINRIHSDPLDHSLKAAMHTFRDLQRWTGQERERRRPVMHHILPARYIPSHNAIKGVNEHYDLATRIIQRLEHLQTSLTAYDTSIVHLKRQHARLLAIMTRRPGFDLRRNGIMSIPQSEVSGLANLSFIDFQNPSLAEAEDGLTKDVLRYDYDLDTVWSPSNLTALRQGVVQICLEETNVHIVSGPLYTICILWRQATSRSEFDGDLLGPVQRSWSFEQTKAAVEHRKMMGHDDDSISEDFMKYYREYRDGEELPAFV